MPGLPTVNLTAEARLGRCPNVCPFNNVTNDDDYDTMNNPCQYTLKVIDVFKPINTTFVSWYCQDNYNNTRHLISIIFPPHTHTRQQSDPLVVNGPDVLTSCGNPSRRLIIGEVYLVGVGGVCDPISAWSTLDSYSESELGIFRELRGADVGLVCGALGTVPSIVTLVLSLLLILLTVVAVWTIEHIDWAFSYTFIVSALNYFNP